MKRLALIAAALAAIAGCSFTTGSNFEECKTDTDCGSVAACSKGYCLTLPAGCRREESGGTVLAFQKEDRIAIAALLPLTEKGAVDDSEVQGLAAMRLAVSEVNDRTGLKNRSFGLFVCDTQREEDIIRAQTRWMVQNLKVPALITSGSGQTQVAAIDPVRLDAGTLIISATATSPSLISTFQREGNVWRVSPPDTQQALALTSLLVAAYPDAGTTRIDVVYEDSTYGAGFANPMTDGLLAAGYTSTRRPFKSGDLNSQTMVINGLANDGPKATVLIAFPPDVRDLIARAKTFPSLTRAMGHRWYLTDACKDPAVLTPSTLPELDQATGTAPAQGAGGAFASFRDSFRTRYNIDPNSFSYTSHSYDAMWLVMLASASAQSTASITGPKLGEGMGKVSNTQQAAIPLRADNWTEASNNLLQGLTINVEGASGPLDFDADGGAASAPYEVWQVSDGGIRVLRLTNP